MKTVLQAGRILAGVQIILGLAFRLLDVSGYKYSTQPADYTVMKVASGMFFTICGSIGLAATHPSALNFKYNHLYVPLTSVVFNIIGSILAAAIPIATLLVTFHLGLSLTTCLPHVPQKDDLSLGDPIDHTAFLASYIIDVLIGMILLAVSVVAALINCNISSCDETDLIRFRGTSTEMVAESSSLGLDDLKAAQDRPPSYEEMGKNLMLHEQAEKNDQ